MLNTINSTISISRLVETAGEKTYTQTVASGIGCYIEPADDTIAVAFDGEGAFEVFALFSDYMDITQADKITDQDSNVYRVKGLKKFDSIVGAHIEAIIQKVYD